MNDADTFFYFRISTGDSIGGHRHGFCAAFPRRLRRADVRERRQHSLLEDREACALEMEKSPEALAYRQNPTAHPEYVSQVFTDMNRCIEHKGWKQVRSQQEQEQVRKRSHQNWLKQVSRRHAQIPRPQNRSCAGSRRDSRVLQARCSLTLSLELVLCSWPGPTRSSSWPTLRPPVGSGP